MNKQLINFKLFIQFSFFKIVILWAKAVQYAIGELWQWADKKQIQLQDDAAKLLVEDMQKEEINDFVKSMQRQAKVIGSRPKKDL
jgi:hypothetical protein